MKKTKLFLKRHSATILTITAAVGVVGTGVSAGLASFKAAEVLRKAKEEKGEDLTKVEVLKKTYLLYLPAVAVGTGTLISIFGANYLNKRTQAALTSAYALLNEGYKEYRNKVTELYGEDADRAVRNSIAKDHYIEDKPDSEDGKILFYDDFSKRYFNAKMEDVIKAEYEVNKAVSLENYVSLNNFYDLLKIDPVEGGDEVGWSADKLFEMYWDNRWVDFKHEKVIMDDGLECIIIYLNTEPECDYLDY